MPTKEKKMGKPRTGSIKCRKDLLSKDLKQTILKTFKALKKDHLSRTKIKELVLKDIEYLKNKNDKEEEKVFHQNKKEGYFFIILNGIEIRQYEVSPRWVDKSISQLIESNALFKDEKGLYPYEYETKELIYGENPEVKDVRKYKIEAHCLDDFYVLMALKDIYEILTSFKFPAMLELIRSFNKPFKIKKEMYWIKLSEEKKQKTLEINIKVSPDWKAYINDEYDEGSIDDIFKEYIKKHWDKRDKKNSIGQSKINYYDEQGFDLANIKGYYREAPICRRCVIGILRKKGDNTWECDKCQKVISQNEFEKYYKEEC